jgi:protein SCO1
LERTRADDEAHRPRFYDEVIYMLRTRLAALSSRTRLRTTLPAVVLLTTFFALCFGTTSVAAQPNQSAPAAGKSAPAGSKSAPADGKTAQQPAEQCHQPPAPRAATNGQAGAATGGASSGTTGNPASEAAGVAPREAVKDAASDGAGKGGAAATAAPIPDVWVTDQDGNRRRFYTDLVRGRVVAINFIFTSCTYVCPMQGQNFGQLQEALGARLGRDVHLVSVSTDPLTDTPARLKAWGAKFGARPGWTLVTGGKAELDELLLALTGDPTGQNKHSPIAFVGDLEAGIWTRSYALAEPERYLRLFADAAARKQQPPAPTPAPARN